MVFRPGADTTQFLTDIWFPIILVLFGQETKQKIIGHF